MATQPARSVTLQSLGEELGLSTATISYVLNGHAQRQKISEATAQRVLKVARARGYVPNMLARSLRRQRSGIIGVVFSNLVHGWADRIMEGMQARLDEHNYIVFASVHRFSPEREAKEINSLLERRVDAIVTWPLPESLATYRAVTQRGARLIFLGDQLEQMPEAASVMWDSAPAMETLVRHLIQTGRRRIGFFCTDHGTRNPLLRHEAYRKAMAEAGLAVEEHWVSICRPAMPASVDDLVRGLLGGIFAPGLSRPDALVTTSDGLALSAFGALAALGLRVPEDVALAGMGDLQSTDLPGYGLTTVREPCEELGGEIAQLALELIEGPPAPIQRLIPCVELKVRHSTVAETREPAIS